MSFLIEAYNNISQELAATNTALVAVSKTKPVEDIQQAYNIGVRDFGENYVQELADKQIQLPTDIRWHFIGHLQTNKVKYIAPFVYLIHGVDSEKLLLEINKQGKKLNKRINCLLQIHIAKEETKFGLNEDELFQIIQKYFIEKTITLDFVNIVGLMGMASFTDNKETIQSEFNFLKQLHTSINEQIKNDSFRVLSMGMSGDYPLAIACGSNMVRIGSLLFGERSYHH